MAGDSTCGLPLGVGALVELSGDGVESAGATAGLPASATAAESTHAFMSVSFSDNVVSFSAVAAATTATCSAGLGFFGGMTVAVNWALTAGAAAAKAITVKAASNFINVSLLAIRGDTACQGISCAD